LQSVLYTRNLIFVFPRIIFILLKTKTLNPELWHLLATANTTSMITIIRTTSDNHDFLELVKLLDADLAIRDGEDHSFYSQFNKLDKIKHVVLAYENKDESNTNRNCQMEFPFIIIF
jgi:hypothetical protein